MSEDRPATRGGFFSRVFSGNLEGEDETTIYPAREVDGEETGGETVETRGFTAGVRIVRGTLEAAGINVDDLANSTGTREAKLNSEIELSQDRIQEFKDRT